MKALSMLEGGKCPPSGMLCEITDCPCRRCDLVVALVYGSVFELVVDDTVVASSKGPPRAVGVVIGGTGQPFHTVTLKEESEDVFVISFEWHHGDDCHCLERGLRVVVTPGAKVLQVQPKPDQVEGVPTTARGSASPARFLVADDASWDHVLLGTSGLSPSPDVVAQVNGAFPWLQTIAPMFAQ